MFEVTIKGFKTKDEAVEFMQWYSGQGEQDIPVWLECRKDEGLDVRECLNTKSIDTDNLIMELA